MSERTFASVWRARWAFAGALCKVGRATRRPLRQRNRDPVPEAGGNRPRSL